MVVVGDGDATSSFVGCTFARNHLTKDSMYDGDHAIINAMEWTDPEYTMEDDTSVLVRCALVIGSDSCNAAECFESNRSSLSLQGVKPCLLHRQALHRSCTCNDMPFRPKDGFCFPVVQEGHALLSYTLQEVHALLTYSTPCRGGIILAQR